MLEQQTEHAVKFWNSGPFMGFFDFPKPLPFFSKLENNSHPSRGIILNVQLFVFSSVIPITICCDYATCAFNSVSLFVSESAFVCTQFVLVIGDDGADRFQCFFFAFASPYV